MRWVGIVGFASVLSAGSLGLGVSAALAAEQVPYSASAFAAAQATGKPIVIDVTAPWCGTCKAQAAIVKAIAPHHAALVIFDVDYDTQKDVMRRFGVRERSTFVVFKGKAEVGRSIGDTDEASVEKLFDKAG